jgi:hypothetical protein
MMRKLCILMAYQPKEKILINADFYSPAESGAQPPAATAAMKTLDRNMLKLDVALRVPIHGHVGTIDDFVKIVGNGQ